ncbi:hypothetical protein LFYK43_15490 [Ligilactobacillus salitolerans]|uniref:MacB-like periplasmic core domain-containing protein n=1 Tax=Ligilactobacillus salitolerans TaxID=1808352 RepID=A0A401IU65_9LACO|nr:ABC transporter permease [Ligilactobacillus salitolerans]GBG95090.1 hypothetical protein LFYK43_15490 [Ligilactobacillus salitolerans]
MFRNKTLLTLLHVGLAFLAVFIFFKIQQRDVVIRLNAHNLSSDAYEVSFKQNLTAADVTEKLTRSKRVDDLQVHFQPKGSKNLTYFFGKGSFATPPLLSGSFFSKSDFVSDLNVAVVGKNLSSKLYQPKDQQYLKVDGKFIPVIGVMGEKINSELDRQIFIAPSRQKLAQMKTSHYRVIIDGERGLKAADLKSILPIKRIAKSHEQQFVLTKWEWATSHKLQLCGLVILVIMACLAILLWVRSSQGLYQQQLSAKYSAQQVALREWGTYSLFNGLGTLLGALLGGLIFEVQNYLPLIIYLVAAFALNSLLFDLLVKKGLRKIQ